MYYFNPSKAEEARRQFNKALTLIQWGYLKEARRFVNQETDIEIHEFAMSLVAYNNYHEMDDLRNLIKFVLCAIEVNRSKHWNKHYKRLRKKVLCEN